MSRGFAARVGGDQFVDPQNPQDIATFDRMELIPEDRTQAESTKEFESIYQEWKTKQESNHKVYELNHIRTTIQAAMAIHMDTPRGHEIFVLFTQNNQNPEKKLKAIPPNIIPGQGGYVLNRKISLSERSGLKPGDILSGKKPYKPSQVAALLDAARSTAGDAPVDQMQGYLRALAAGKGHNYRIPGGAEFASLHQKYLGEWAAPIALITKQLDQLDQIPDLEENMLDGASVSKGSIIYNTSTSATLTDSSVKVNHMNIEISSKRHQSGGAAASLKSLDDTIKKKADQFEPGFWEDPHHARFKHVLEVIMNRSAIQGPLELAADEGIITRGDITQITSAIENPDYDMKLSPKATKVRDSYEAYEGHPHYNAGKHALAAIAKAVCAKLNGEDFTGVVKTILNHSNMIQMLFVTGLNGPDLICKGFQLIWPPRFRGDISIYSGKSYTATEVRGKLTFKIGKVREEDVQDDSLQAPSLSTAQKLKQKEEAERAVGKIRVRGERDKRDVAVSDEIALGRTKKAR